MRYTGLETVDESAVSRIASGKAKSVLNIVGKGYPRYNFRGATCSCHFHDFSERKSEIRSEHELEKAHLRFLRAEKQNQVSIYENGMRHLKL